MKEDRNTYPSMKNIKLSIIIPIYNAVQYIQRTLESIAEQTLREIEVICVLDCPTDGTDQIVLSFAQKDSRFKVLANEVGLHIGGSRNKGLSVAQGEYIGFCDHDDWCDPQMFETLYVAAKAQNADTVLSHVCTMTPNDQKQVFPIPTTDFKTYSAVQNIILATPSHPGCVSYGNDNSVWTHLYKKSFLDTYHIHFVDTKKISPEDRLFNIECYLHNPKVVGVDKTLYYWQLNSMNTSYSYAYRSPAKIIGYIRYLYQLLKQANQLEDYRQAFSIGYVRKLYTSYCSEVRVTNWISTFFKIRKQLQEAQIEEIRSYVRHSHFLFQLPPTKALFYLFCLK